MSFALHNFTSLTDGQYYYNVSVYDEVGFYNITAARKLTLDNTWPTISFSTGTELNNTYWNRNNFLVNTSITEVNVKNLTFYLFDENKTRMRDTTSPAEINASLENG